MRIITGTARGTVLSTLEGDRTRPTADRVKESLFSMLQFELEGRRILDLFAGSGALALEALSRGAEKATLIDENREAVDVIIANAKKTHLFEKCRIGTQDYAAFLKANAGKDTYDIVFLDPPYAAGLLPTVLKKLVQAQVLVPGAVVVCESETPEVGRGYKGKKNDEEELASMKETLFAGDSDTEKCFEIRKNATYGRVRITLLTYQGGGYSDNS